MQQQQDSYHFSAKEKDFVRNIWKNRHPPFLLLLILEEDALEQLRAVQNELNQQGASDLVVELLISQSSSNVLEESIHLAIALLEGGNSQVQVSDTLASHLFLTVFYSRPVSFGICMAVKWRRRDSFKFSTRRSSAHRRSWRVWHRWTVWTMKNSTSSTTRFSLRNHRSTHRASRWWPVIDNQPWLLRWTIHSLSILSQNHRSIVFSVGRTRAGLTKNTSMSFDLGMSSFEQVQALEAISATYQGGLKMMNETPSTSPGSFDAFDLQ